MGGLWKSSNDNSGGNLRSDDTNLIESLQRGAIASPTSRAFSIGRWVNLAKDASPDDRKIVGFGMLLHSALDQLRAGLRFINDRTVSVALRRRAVVSLANRETLLSWVIVTEQITKEYAPGTTLPLDQIANQKIALAGGDFTADEIAQSVVDTLEKMLRLLSPDGSNDAGPTATVDWDRVARDLNVASAYGALEGVWMDVVWNGFRTVSGNPLTLESITPNEEIERVIGQHRYRLTSIQNYTGKFLSTLNSATEESERSDDLSYITISIDGGKASLKVGHPTREILAGRRAKIASSVPDYYSAKTLEAGPLYADLSLNLVVNGYLLLSDVAGQLATLGRDALAKEREEKRQSVDLLELAPLMQRSDLVSALAEALTVSSHVAAILVRFFVIGDAKSAGQPSDDIWSAPLVSLDAETIVLAVHPPLHGNLRRLVDVWLKRLGFSLDFRGTELELFVRKAVGEAISHSQISAISFVHDSSFVFVSEGRREEIDLVAVIGKYVVLGEVKCFLEPSAPLEWANHRQKLTEAAHQISRKANAVRKSGEEFLRRSKELGIPIPQGFELIPIVILNTAIGAGQSIEGVPIIDLRIFEMFFEGGIARMTTMDPKGGVESGFIEVFYLSPEEAEANVIAYMSNPPQVSYLRHAVRPRDCQVLFPAASEGVLVTRHQEVDLSEWSNLKFG